MLNESEIARTDQGTGRPRDAGSALIMAVLVSVVVFVLGAMWMSIASHENSASNNDRRRQHAIDAAMAGLVVADSELTRKQDYPGSGVVAFGGSAEFEVVEVEVLSEWRRRVTSVGYAPSKANIARTVRTVEQVVDVDPVGFTYGIFTAGNFSTGSLATVAGDVYSRGSISIGNVQNHVGDMYAFGSISTGANQETTGSLYANGDIILQASSSEVKGSAYAGAAINTNNGWIRGDAQAGGLVDANPCPTDEPHSQVGGSCLSNSPPPRVPDRILPEFAYPSVYVEVTGASVVEAVEEPGSSGIYYVDGDVTFGQHDDFYLTGDLTIVATGSITLPRVITNSPSDKEVQLTLISTGSGTIGPAKTLSIPATVRTLIYTQGLFEANQQSTFTGVLYAGEISAKAKLSVNYAQVSDPGFNWSAASAHSFTIRNISTHEVANGS